MRTMKAIAQREGRWWVISIPSIDVVTQSRNLSDAPQMALEAAAITLDVDEKTLDIELSVNVPPRIQKAWEKSREQDESARRIAHEAGQLARDTIRELHEEGISQKDIAHMLKISPQRVSQLQKRRESVKA